MTKQATKNQIDLVWIAVTDLKRSLQFFQEVLGLEVREHQEEWNWAEVQGADGGCVLGIAQEDQHIPVKSGTNSIVTLSVDDIDTAIEKLKSKGTPLVGEIVEIPGEIKMQLFKDPDGNFFQLVEKLS